jgi:hypothetical protein
LRATGLNTNTGFLQAQLTISKVRFGSQQTDKRVRPVKAGGIKVLGQGNDNLPIVALQSYLLSEGSRIEERMLGGTGYPVPEKRQSGNTYQEEFL